jgi:site-specific DNA-methyltransferase (adenine-specific)
MAVRIEDAGFEIRDQIMWIYGSGFPKSHNIGKAVDKLEGNEREVVGEKVIGSVEEGLKKGVTYSKANPNNKALFGYGTETLTKGNSEWEGWGTALKPAHEPIVMARKPIVGTVANNVLEWGVGGINIDGCRIGVEPTDDIFAKNPHTTGGFGHGEATIYGDSNGADNYEPSKGRFPANIIFDEEAGKILDEQSGFSESTSTKTGYTAEDNIFFKGLHNKVTVRHNDGDGASRFFYCPKTSKNDRNEGVEDKNIHPTVKPTDLMAYLVRLVTPKGGIVLDPFMGSGSTGKGAVREGMVFIGIERESEYFEIAEARIQNEIDNLGKPKKVSKQKETKVEPIVENKFWE